MVNVGDSLLVTESVLPVLLLPQQVDHIGVEHVGLTLSETARVHGGDDNSHVSCVLG